MPHPGETIIGGGATAPQASRTEEEKQPDRTTTPSASQGEDRDILRLFYNRTSGVWWGMPHGWQENDRDLRAWYGVKCNDEGRVIGLVLVRESKKPDKFMGRLTGKIPREMGRLGTLLDLVLKGNELEGPIPEELGNLRALERLDLSSNRLKGDIPPALGHMVALVSISLEFNQLSGTLPKEWGSLHLHHLDVRHNRLTGLGDTASALSLVTHFRTTGKFVCLENNPWRMPPEAVAKKGLSCIQGFLEDLRKAEEAGRKATSLQLLKVVLVGSSTAGKTSLMQSIVRRRASQTTGDVAAASTVGIDLRRHQLEGTYIEFYDCAGQLDYLGMHQTFLSRRALYLLVWDIQNFQNDRREELDDVYHKHIMRWLYTLKLRAPTSTVILVANKRDTAFNAFAATASGVEQRVRNLLERQGNNPGANEINLLEDVSCVSCHDYSGIEDLIRRIQSQSATSILVPPAWERALKMIDALRDGRSPSREARQHLNLPVDEEVAERRADTFVTKAELSRLWEGVIQNIADDIEARGNKLGDAEAAVLSNPKGALEGALWISEFAGQILAIEDGKAVFLDVVWLSNVLSPIMSHKLKDEHFADDTITAARDDLINKGILTPTFAEYLWNDLLSNREPVGSQLRDSVLKGLYRVLLELGIIVPIGQPAIRVTDQNPLEGYGYEKDALVIMQLPDACSPFQEQEHESHIRGALKKRNAREVTLRWELGVAEVPYGMVERVIASCHAIGVVQPDLCWRYGALFKSRATTTNYWVKVSLYIVVVDYKVYYDTSRARAPRGVLRVRMVGPLESRVMWAALRYVASAVVILSKEGWPGLLWSAWPESSRNPNYHLYLAPPTKAIIGSGLISSEALVKYRGVDDSVLREDEIIRAVAENLGNVIDTRTENPFEGLPEEEIPMCNCISELIELGKPYAWKTAVSLGSIALTLFIGSFVAGMVREIDVLWQASLGVIGLILLCAAGAAGFACLEKIREAGRGVQDGGVEPEDAHHVTPAV